MSLRINTPKTVIVTANPAPLPFGQDTQLLTNVNNVNTFSYPGYNFKGKDFVPSLTLDASSIPLSAESNKYWGGCLAPNGKIYCIPYTGTDVGIINPYTDTIDKTTISGLSSAGNKYLGGVCAPNGKIYCMPLRSAITNVGIIDTNTNTFNTTAITGLIGDYKYAGAVLAPNGKIYGIPYSSSNLLVIDPTDNSYNTFPIGLSSTFKWAGGVLAPNGKIYCIPQNFSRPAIIDPSTNTIDTSFGTATGYFGGVLAPNGKIYCIPRSATNVGIIDPNTNTIDTSTISFPTYPDLSSGISNKYFGGALGLDGKIYCTPFDGLNVGIIDPVNNTFNSVAIPAPSGSKYGSGVLGPNGKIYCIAHTASNIGIVKTSFPALQPWMMAPEFNKL
jgi:hypothetical protein